MTKITRKDQQIFASTAGDESVAKFGSLAAGSPGYSTDPDEIQTDEYKGGWESAVIGQASPTMEDRNALDYLYSRQLGYLYQQGIPEYSATTTFYKGSVVSYFDADEETLKLYYSLVDDNTGNSLEDDTKWAEFKSGGGASLPLLTFQFTDHELNDVSWLKANFSWCSGDVYVAAYRHLKNDLGFRYASSTLTVSHNDFDAGTYVRISTLDQVVDTTTYYAWGISGTTDKTKCIYTLTTTLANGVKIFYYYKDAILQLTSSIVEAQTETIKGITVTFYRAEDGHKIAMADQEMNLVDLHNATGTAWYFLFDETNTMFKLPRTNYNFKVSDYGPGDYVPESLPNIRGEFSLGQTVGVTTTSLATGAFSNGSTTYVNVAQGTAVSAVSKAFNAAGSSSTYQDSAPVQERATKAFLYFYVGSFDKEAIEQTAGITVENFQQKADTDLGNIDTNGKATICRMLSPSTYNVDITLGASNSTYTAPGDGWFALGAHSSSAAYTCVMSCNYVVSQARAVGATNSTNISLYVGKGDVMTLYYDGFSSVEYFKFVYAKGSEPQ